jgi:predicted unusual protein kinase regulating ubiquinone biosynthesis (AarF/ABC1/UbiB family)
VRKRTVALGLALAGIGVVVARKRPARGGAGAKAVGRSSRTARNAETVRLASSIGATLATTKAQKVFASAARRDELDRAAELKTAEAIAASLGSMKGALMKVGQMASYLDDGLPEPVRQALAGLQADAPPMSAELAAAVVEEELGSPPDRVFVEWDPVPIAAASIGQVHRAVVVDPADGVEKAVAVKVQYPGVDEAIGADLDNADFMGTILGMVFKGLDPEPLVEEIRARVSEELDYAKEAANQRLFADFYRQHPFIHVPDVIDALSTRRVLTSELAVGSRFDELLTWDQQQRDLAAETIFRFVFRSLYRFGAFNGDPHPGNYLFLPGGRVTFLDFGLVKHFTPAEITAFERMISAACIQRDWAEFRTVVEDVGLLHTGAPIGLDDVRGFYELFYEMVLEDRVITYTPEHASAAVRRLFAPDSPVAQHSTVPSSFVLIQRINMGLLALLAKLGATGNYRRIAEELWPMVDGPPSTPLGEEEAAWLADSEGARRGGP